MSSFERRWLSAMIESLLVKMDKDILPFKNTLQHYYRMILGKEDLQIELLFREPIGFEGYSRLPLTDDYSAFVRLLQGPGEIEAKAQGIRGAADGGFLSLPDFIFRVTEPG